jgi:hypothetical protein
VSRSQVGPTARGVGCLVLLSLVAALGHAGPSPLVHREVFRIEVRPLTASLRGDEPPRLDLTGDRPAETRFRVDWPADGQVAEVWLRAKRLGPGDEDKLRVSVTSELRLPGEPPVRRERRVELGGATTALLEVYRVGEDALTLALSGGPTRVAAVADRRTVGAPVRLDLEILGVRSGQTVPLETNQLHTFLGEPVTYAFRLGEAGKADSGQITVMPVRLLGGTVELQVEISGTLLDEDATPRLVSRTESWFTMRGATSSSALQVGDPPRGYEFRVTPWF